jgi:hypothetical protein
LLAVWLAEYIDRAGFLRFSVNPLFSPRIVTFRRIPSFSRCGAAECTVFKYPPPQADVPRVAAKYRHAGSLRFKRDFAPGHFKPLDLTRYPVLAFSYWGPTTRRWPKQRIASIAPKKPAPISNGEGNGAAMTGGSRSGTPASLVKARY